MVDAGSRLDIVTARPVVAVLLIGAAVGAQPLPGVTLLCALAGSSLLLLRRAGRPSTAEMLLLGTLLGGVASSLSGLPWHVGLLSGVLGAAVFSPGALRQQLGAWWGALRWTRAGTALLLASTAAGCWFVTWEIASRSDFYFAPVTSSTILSLAAVGNAAAEELVWRGAAVTLLLVHGTPKVLTLTVSSISFGIAHLSSGVPDGLMAVPTAGAYGVAMCLLAWASRSLWLPLFSHVAVDLAVVAALAG